MKRFILLSIILSLSLTYAAITNASIVNVSNTAFINMSWDSSTTKAYIDGAAGNPDVTIQVCGDLLSDVQNKYAKFVYRTGNITGFQNIAKEPSTEYTQLSTCAGTCCVGSANFNFNSLWAVYPAYAYALVSSDTTFDETDTFVMIPLRSWLRGYYQTNDVEASYNQANGNITLQITGVKSWTGSAYATNSEDYPYFQIGVCTPNNAKSYYWECTGGYSGASRGTSYSVHTGVVAPPDTSIAYRYSVINGLGVRFCIGPDPSITSVSLNPSTQNAGGKVNVTVSIRNDGNVDITQTFNVTVSVDGSDVQNLTVSGGLAAYTSTTRSFNLSTGAYSSGTHTVAARISPTTIADCDASNNQSSATLTLNPSYLVRMFINGTENNTFPDAGRPYNISINVSDTDGNPGNGILVRIYEDNGINIFAPIQKISSSPNRGLKAVAYGESTTDSNGIVNFTIIPTGNKLYTSQYAYTQIDQYVGNYSLYIEVFNATTGEELQQTNGTALIDQFDIVLSNYTARTPNADEMHTFYADNHDDYVQLMSEFIYNMFSTISGWLVE